MSSIRRFSDFSIGDTIWFEKVFEEDAFEPFAKLSGDRNPLHHDANYAQGTAVGRVILPVHLAASPISAIAGMGFPGEASLYLEHTVRARLPIYYGDKLVYSARIMGITAARRILTLRVCVFRNVELVLEADVTVQARYDEWSSAPAWEILKPSRTRTCLITGASGAIGLATAKLLAARGWNLILHHRSGSVELMVAECGPGARIQVVRADLASHEGAAKLANFVSTADVDAVVHCASASIDSPVDELVATNFSALQLLCDATIGTMLRKQEGRIIFIGSQAVDYLPRGWANYVAAKAAAETVVKGIRKHYGHLGIQAGTLAPSFVDSSFSEKWRTSTDTPVLPEYVAEHVVRMLEEGIPLYRNLDPSGVRDVAVAIPESGVPAYVKSVPAARPADTEVPANARNGHERGAIARLDEVVRRTLKLPQDSDLSQVALGVTSTWDSLAHLQLIVAIEQALEVSFSSQEIERMLRYQDLVQTCEQKVQVVAGRN